MLVSSFNLSQSFNDTPYLFYKKRFKKRSIVSVYGPWCAGELPPEQDDSRHWATAGVQQGQGGAVLHYTLQVRAVLHYTLQVRDYPAGTYIAS
jgi:hypothetical protein